MNEYNKDLVEAVIVAKLDIWKARQEKVKFFFEDNKAEIKRIKGLDASCLADEFLKCNDDPDTDLKKLRFLGQRIAVDYVLYRSIDGYQEHSNLKDSLSHRTNSVIILEQALRKIDCIVSEEITFNEREEGVIFGDEIIY